VLVEQVDGVGAQTLQRGICHSPDLLWTAVESAFAASDVETVLGGDNDLVAHGFEGLADEFLLT
jgi:hypothetical protein